MKTIMPWFEHVKKLKKEYVVFTPRLCGVPVILHYHKFRLVEARATIDDKQVEVTKAASLLKSVPRSLVTEDYATWGGEKYLNIYVRGVVLIPNLYEAKDVIDRVGGFLLDPKKSVSRHLEFVAINAHREGKEETHVYLTTLMLLFGHGFSIPKLTTTATLDEMESEGPDEYYRIKWREMQQKSGLKKVRGLFDEDEPRYPYLVTGMNVTVNSIKGRRKLGKEVWFKG